ncbi:hemolysin-III related [Trypanosoma brucei equiperdum]|uniref:Hemolysin-III related n=1 Tax=Trypanosoma brucei equiperdum TaxID=630700 RepID=A0A3L6L1J5_9TRYP|nr:hemolysin-III related [Trypanosoma brucei equiperdum]
MISSRFRGENVSSASTTITTNGGDQSEKTCSSSSSMRAIEAPVPYNSNPDLPLYTVDQVPPHLAENLYIHSGYRMNYSTGMCFRSVLALHNETFNVWTHLIGFVIFLIVSFVFSIGVLIPRLTDRPGDGSETGGSSFPDTVSLLGFHWPTLSIFAVYSVSCLMCMLCSAAFHTLIPHNHPVIYRIAHTLDYFGITFLVVGSFLPMCYFCFACKPHLRYIYLIMVSLFGVGGLVGPCFRRWTDPAYMCAKITFYVCMVGSGLLPVCHIYLTLPSSATASVVQGLLLMMGLYGVGVMIYALKVPESLYPGEFDIYLSSHQLWHVFVLCAAVVHFFNCASMYINFDKMALNC